MSTVLNEPITADQHNLRYKAVSGSNISNAAARRYGPEITRLAREEGLTQPEQLVDFARDTDSPLHDFDWEWDDAVAASRFRVTQAAYLCRAISIEWDDRHGDTHEMRAFHFVPMDIVCEDVEDEVDEEDDGGALVRPRFSSRSGATTRVLTTARDIIEQPQLQQYVVDQAREEFEVLQRKFQHYFDTLPRFRGTFRTVWAELQCLFNGDFDDDE